MTNRTNSTPTNNAGNQEEGAWQTGPTVLPRTTQAIRKKEHDKQDQQYSHEQRRQSGRRSMTNRTNSTPTNNAGNQEEGAWQTGPTVLPLTTQAIRKKEHDKQDQQYSHEQRRQSGRRSMTNRTNSTPTNNAGNQEEGAWQTGPTVLPRTTQAIRKKEHDKQDQQYSHYHRSTNVSTPCWRNTEEGRTEPCKKTWSKKSLAAHE